MLSQLSNFASIWCIVVAVEVRDTGDGDRVVAGAYAR